MFRTKLKSILHLTLLTACLFIVSGCNKDVATSAKPIEEMLNLNALSADNSLTEDVYEVAEVVIGDISETDSVMAAMNFPIYHEIFQEYEHGTVVFKSYQLPTSSASAYVEEGEIVAILELMIDPISREESKIKYEKALLSYENTVERKTKDLENQLEDIEDETNVYQKQILELDYEVALKAYNEYVAEQTEYLEELKEVVEIYSQDSYEIEVKSPCDGMISFQKFTKGEIIDPDKLIASVSSYEKYYLTAYIRGEESFKLGKTVEISQMSVTPTITLQGKIIAAPNVIDATKLNAVTIEITSPFPEITTMSSQKLRGFTATIRTDYVKDGIIIPTKALSNVSDNTGTVYVLENGVLNKKNVKIGYRGSDYTWILEGLEPGQKVTIK